MYPAQAVERRISIGSVYDILSVRLQARLLCAIADVLLEELSRKTRWSELLPDGALDPEVLQVSVTRAGEEPGMHVVGLDGPDDRIEVRHQARGRSGFARGALVAARWIRGRQGLFTLDDMLAEPLGQESGS